MITVTIRKNSSDVPVYVSVKGHAGYAAKGSDIICSAVSVLTINTANSLERFLNEDDSDCIQKNDEIIIKLNNTESSKGVVLMSALVNGLEDIEKEYGKKYITLNIEEV